MSAIDPSAAALTKTFEAAVRTRGSEELSPSLASEFGDALREKLNETNASLVDSENRSVAFAEGETHDIDGTMVALQRADISLRFATAVRNRVVEAYREVMRMSA